uniref:Uncharacterized protein n=1 Tax=Brassica oleracea var. oleracea TaxID=109376 RepID=A0A0D3E3T2_BRAOL
MPLRGGGSPPIKWCIFLKHIRDINPSIFSILQSTWRSKGFAYVTFSSKGEAFVDGRLLILSTTRVVNHNRPFLHIKDPNTIRSQSAAPGLGLGFIDDGIVVIGQE